MEFSKLVLENAGLIRGQRYRTEPDSGIPMLYWRKLTYGKNAGLTFHSIPFRNLLMIFQLHALQQV